MRLARLLSLLVLHLALTGNSYAQYSINIPARSSRAELIPLHELRSSGTHSGQYTLPPLPKSIGELRSSTLSADTELRPFIYAKTRQLPTDIMRYGTWLRDSDGNYVWRLTLTSPDARGLALRLEHYHLPKGATVYAFGSEGGKVGALTEANNSSHGILQLSPLSGESITIEYELPQGRTPKGDEPPPFILSAVEHDYIGVRSLGEVRGKKAGYGEPFFDDKLSLEKMSCAPNAIAYPERRQQARSVVVLAIGGAMSSGALINTMRSDERAYILTAAHNVNGLYDPSRNLDQIKAAVRGAVIFFGFESPSIEGNIRGTEEMTLSGAELVAYDPDSDMALLEITGLPVVEGKRLPIPEEYNAYFAGWSIDPQPHGPFFGIHHPGILTKRYSEVLEDKLSIVDFTTSSGRLSWYMKHWHIPHWAVGSTAAGSSGSPLFDGEGRIIGALTAGFSYCPDGYRTAENDYYFAIHRAWENHDTPKERDEEDLEKEGEKEEKIPNGLAQFLDPDNTGQTSCPGYDPHASAGLYRMSDFYANDRGVRLLAESASSSGLGRIVSLTGESTPLGAYLIFKGNTEIQGAFPPLVIELSPYDRDKKSVSSPVWHTEIMTTPRYPFFRPLSNDYSLGSYESGARTLAYDTIELFVPNLPQLSTSTVRSGEYLLSVRSKDMSALRLDMLHSNLPITTTQSNLWRLNAGTWEPQSPMNPQRLWIDLLVKSTSPQTLKATPLEDLSYIEAFYHGGYLSIRIPSEAKESSVDIFSETGKLVARYTLTGGEQRIALHHLSASAMYVAKIRSSVADKVIKFIVP